MLLDQLRVLDTWLEDVEKSAYAGDAEMVVTSGKFLENRFRKSWLL